MCKQIVVLELIKKNKEAAGMTDQQISLAEAQAEDLQAMQKQIDTMQEDISDIKDNLTDLRKDNATLSGKLDILIQHHEKDEPVMYSLVQIVTKLSSNKYFWWILALVICLSCKDSLLELKELVKAMGYLI